MSAKVINIWIVEDDENDAKRAFGAIERVGAGQNYKVFLERALIWGADLYSMPVIDNEIPLPHLDHMPDIVILDLLDAGGGFLAGRFYEGLRKEERDRDLPASFVIMWSVKTGLPDVHRFLGSKLKVDRRLMFTNTKTVPDLEENLTFCLESWLKARYL
jgi:hypothetical protein